MENYNFLTCLALVSENFTCLINFGLNHASLINPLLSSSQSWKKKKRSKGIPATMVFCLPSGPSLASLKCSLPTTWLDLCSNVEWDYRMFPFIICSCSVILIVSYGGLILENCWCLYVKISCLPQFLFLPPAPPPHLVPKNFNDKNFLFTGRLHTSKGFSPIVLECHKCQTCQRICQGTGCH